MWAISRLGRTNGGCRRGNVGIRSVMALVGVMLQQFILHARAFMQVLAVDPKGFSSFFRG